MDDLDLSQKRVLIREDLNAPLRDGVITNDARLQAALPTIQTALAAGAAVIVMSHLGQPKGRVDLQYSLQPVADYLTKHLGQSCKLISDWTQGVTVNNGECVLCENVRFEPGETSNDKTLAKHIASLCDIFVMDAFAAAHRQHASTVGAIEFAPQACAGPLLLSELQALETAFAAPQHPVVAIVGGSKASTKLTLLESLIKKVDHLIVGGGIANTFIAAAGFPIGKSLYEADLVDLASNLMQQTDIPLPSDVIVATEISATAKAVCKQLTDVTADEMILDIGPETAKHFSDQLQQAKTIIWNGPVGVFEFDQFATGTQALAQAIAASDAFSAAGGGDTLAAIDKFGIRDKVSYISTGGGAFLQYLEGKTLPAVAALQLR